MSSTSACWPTKRPVPSSTSRFFGILGLKPVEIFDLLDRRDRGLFHAAGEEAIGATEQLVLDEQLQEFEERH